MNNLKRKPVSSKKTLYKASNNLLAVDFGHWVNMPIQKITTILYVDFNGKFLYDRIEVKNETK
jgi:hypothetical protein